MWGWLFTLSIHLLTSNSLRASMTNFLKAESWFFLIKGAGIGSLYPLLMQSNIQGAGSKCSCQKDILAFNLPIWKVNMFHRCTWLSVQLLYLKPPLFVPHPQFPSTWTVLFVVRIVRVPLAHLLWVLINPSVFEELGATIFFKGLIDTFEVCTTW